MFDNIGDKIKAWAQIICWLGIIACVIYAIVVFETNPAMSLVVVLVGSLLSWFGSLILYGFGQLIDNSDKIIALNAHKFDNDYEINACEKYGSKLIGSAEFCGVCGTENIERPRGVVNEYDALEMCKKCGADITNDVYTCHICGEKKD